MATAQQSAAAKARAAKAAKAKAEDVENQAVVDDPLLKFVNPTLAAEKEAEKANAEPVQEAPVAEEPETPVETGDEDKGEPEEAPEPAQNPAEKTVTVIVDAVALGPGNIAGKGQKITLPAGKADRLIRLKAAK